MRRQSARFKTEEREATEDLFETNGEKVPVSPLCDNVVHESGPTCSLLEKETPTIEAVQAKEKPDNKRFVGVCLIVLSKYIFSVGFHYIYKFFMVS